MRIKALSDRELYKAFPEIKDLAVEVLREGVPSRMVAETLDIPRSYLYRWQKDGMVSHLLEKNPANMKRRSEIMTSLRALRKFVDSSQISTEIELQKSE